MKLKQGDIVYVWWLGLPVFHYGIVVDDGAGIYQPIIRTVFPGCNSPCDQTLSQFTNGNPSKIRRRKIESAVTAHQAVVRALGTTRFDYNLLFNNCEHFYRRCYGLPEFSEQVVVAGIALSLTTILSGGKIRLSA